MSQADAIKYVERKLKKQKRKKNKEKVALHKQVLKYLKEKREDTSGVKKKLKRLSAKYERLKEENQELKAQLAQLRKTPKAKSLPSANQKEKVQPSSSPFEMSESPKPKESEDLVWERIQEKAKYINFDRLGRVEPSQKDDLKKIKGIGPLLEKRLNVLGIYTYEQISKFSPKDEVMVNEAIEYFQGRISRDNWVEQAIELMS